MGVLGLFVVVSNIVDCGVIFGVIWIWVMVWFVCVDYYIFGFLGVV